MLPQALQPYALTAAGHRLSATLLGHERRPGSLHSQAGVSIVESVQIPPGLRTRESAQGRALCVAAGLRREADPPHSPRALLRGSVDPVRCDQRGLLALPIGYETGPRYQN